MAQLPEKLQAARLLLVNKCPYLAHAVYAAQPVATPGLPAAMASDKFWRMYYDPNTLDKPCPDPHCGGQVHDVAQTAAIIGHEIAGHLLRNHFDRLAHLNDVPMLANVCGDLEYNDDPCLPLPPCAIVPKHFGLPDGKLAEEYADLLPKSKMPKQGGAGSGNCGSAADGKARGYEAPEPGPDGKAADGSEAIPAISKHEADVIKRQVAEAVKQAAARGNVPGNMVRWADSVLHKPRDWRAELRAAVRGEVTRASGHNDYTYARAGRRSQLFAPLCMPAMVTTLPRLAIVVDTSGSMSAHAGRTTRFNKAYAEVKAVVQQTGARCAIIATDAQAAAPVWVVGAMPKALPLAGGGGTDMSVGIAAAMRLVPKPHSIIVITDGETPWPREAPGVPVVAGIVGTNERAPQWAKTVVIDKA